MAAYSSVDKLIAIVGPTASGKTSLAIEIAEQYNGEIICADSRTVYKGMDIGTAKPTAEEQARVRHWGLDLVLPNERFSAADFQAYANKATADINSRGKLALLVGGTGLYVDAVLYDFTFGPVADETSHENLKGMSVEELTKYCNENNVLLPENSKNKRHLINAIKRKDVTSISKSILKRNHYIVGIATSMSALRTQIENRTEHMFESNVEDEATMLGKMYGWDSEAMTGNGYPLIKKHLEGMTPIEETKAQFSTLDYQLAKRQMTWFRRNPDIMWANQNDAKSYLQSLLVRE